MNFKLILLFLLFMSWPAFGAEESSNKTSATEVLELFNDIPAPEAFRIMCIETTKTILREREIKIPELNKERIDAMAHSLENFTQRFSMEKLKDKNKIGLANWIAVCTIQGALRKEIDLKPINQQYEAIIDQSLIELKTLIDSSSKEAIPEKYWSEMSSSFKDELLRRIKQGQTNPIFPAFRRKIDEGDRSKILERIKSAGQIKSKSKHKVADSKNPINIDFFLDQKLDSLVYYLFRYSVEINPGKNDFFGLSTFSSVGPLSTKHQPWPLIMYVYPRKLTDPLE